MNSIPPKSRRRKRWDIPNTTHEIIKQNGPMRLQELKQKLETLTEGKINVSLSILHTELNMDRRFVFTPQNLWALKSQVVYRLRNSEDDYDIIEGSYQPLKADYKTTLADDEEITDDESELLVPFSDESIDDDDDSPVIDEDDLAEKGMIDDEDLDDEDDEDDEDELLPL